MCIQQEPDPFSPYVHSVGCFTVALTIATSKSNVLHTLLVSDPLSPFVHHPAWAADNQARGRTTGPVPAGILRLELHRLHAW